MTLKPVLTFGLARIFSRALKPILMFDVNRIFGFDFGRVRQSDVRAWHIPPNRSWYR
jgi:hypothetical protein